METGRDVGERFGTGNASGQLKHGKAKSYGSDGNAKSFGLRVERKV
jgi:hypothetical protein